MSTRRKFQESCLDFEFLRGSEKSLNHLLETGLNFSQLIGHFISPVGDHRKCKTEVLQFLEDDIHQDSKLCNDESFNINLSFENKSSFGLYFREKSDKVT